MTFQPERIAYITSQTAAMLAEMEGMKALNAERESHGYAQGYDEGSFMELPAKYGIDHNSVIIYLRDASAQ